jgi:hypothetical protein
MCDSTNFGPHWYEFTCMYSTYVEGGHELME